MHPLAQYSINDFDKHNCLKLFWGFYLLLAFLLRGYVIGVLSLSNLRDKLSLIQWFYPESSLFYLSLLSGIPALMLLLLMFSRKPEASDWIKNLWPKFLLLCSFVFIIDLSFYWGLFLFEEQGQLKWLIGQSILGLLIIALCKFSTRATINLSEFPETITVQK